MRLTYRSALVLVLAACSHKLDGPSPNVSNIDPPLVCNAVETTLTLTGSGLSPLAEDALTGDPKLALPEIQLQRVADAQGNPVTDAPILLCEGTDPTCTRVKWISQTEMQFTVDPALMLEAGTYHVIVTNANGKSYTATVELDVVEPPMLTGISPQSLCPSGGTVTVEGTGFNPNATVTIGGQDVTVTQVTDTMVTGTLGPGLDPGTYDVVVDNGAGCIDTLPGAFTVVPGPTVFFVDPPIVYNGISVQSTIYVSGVDVPPATVGITPNGSGDPLTELDHTWDPARPNKILATIPSGLTTGGWDVTVQSSGCEATLPNGITVVDTLTVAVAGIDPPFGWTSEDTAVTITATDPAPAGMVQFQPTPRVYLNPDVAGPTTVASALTAVVWVDATRLTAIVPSGLPAGLYDVVVVNPDGSVGLLDQAFTVTDVGAPPPTISGITPASVINTTGQNVTISGNGFRNPTVQGTCQDDTGITVIVDGVVNSSTTTSIDVTFDMTPLTAGVCVLRVTDDDGTYGDFSALAVTNPAQNLPATVSDDGMIVARRGLSATAGRVTAQARYLYAIGGDDGTDAGLLTSIEAAPVDLFGRLAPWSTLPGVLPAGRSRAGVATIGRFIYLIGGNTGVASDSAIRAEILDPRAAPQINDLVFDYVDTDGLDPGLYYYRVSAIMDPSDASNPGGETLAGDPFTVIVPPAGNKKVKLTLYWDAVPNAAMYRVYRTTGPDMLLADIVELETIPATATPSYIDLDTATPGTKIPLPDGALGEWREIGPLSAPRDGAGVAFAPDPDAPDAFFLYAIGGLDDNGVALDDYDMTRVVIAGDGSQTVDPFAPGGTLLANGRWQLSAVTMDHQRSSVIPDGDTWIYAMAGLNSAGTGGFRDVTASMVQADGTLSPVYEVNQMLPGQTGYGVAGANNHLFAFGGSATNGGFGTTSAVSAEICPVGSCTGGTIPEPPDLVNWNNLGFTLLQARYLPGSSLESAFIFLVGGASDTVNATSTVERTHW